MTGNPGRTVIDFDGDGSFSMTMNEVITAVRYQQPVKFIVLDNTYGTLDSVPGGRFALHEMRLGTLA